MPLGLNVLIIINRLLLVYLCQCDTTASGTYRFCICKLVKLRKCLTVLEKTSGKYIVWNNSNVNWYNSRETLRSQMILVKSINLIKTYFSWKKSPTKCFHRHECLWRWKATYYFLRNHKSESTKRILCFHFYNS